MNNYIDWDRLTYSFTFRKRANDIFFKTKRQLHWCEFRFQEVHSSRLQYPAERCIIYDNFLYRNLPVSLRKRPKKGFWLIEFDKITEYFYHYELNSAYKKLEESNDNNAEIINLENGELVHFRYGMDIH